MIEEYRIDQTFDGAVQVSIVIDNERRLATQFQSQLDALAGSRPPDDAPDSRRASEGDLVQIVMRDQRRARFITAGNDIDDARRQASFSDDLSEEQGGKRCVGRGFDDHGVAGRQCRRDLPGQHQQREVPGDDLTDHAQRLIVAQLSVQQLRPAGVMIKVAGDQRHINIARFADGLAVVQAFDHCQQACVLLNVASDGVEVTRALMWTEGRPGLVGAASGRYGGVDVGGAGVGDLCQGFAARRVGDGESSCLR